MFLAVQVILGFLISTFLSVDTACGKNDFLHTAVIKGNQRSTGPNIIFYD